MKNSLFFILFMIFQYNIIAQKKIEPKSDCKDAIILCDKSPLEVSYAPSNGVITNEITSADCLLEESSSSWLKWICDTPGIFTFVISPKRENDDMDFMVFEVNSVNDICEGKKVVRCAATSCPGKTGLLETELDTIEDFNCDVGENGFVKAIEMKKGKAYTMVINNFTQSGLGFDISFGGTSSFLDICSTNVSETFNYEILIAPNPVDNELKFSSTEAINYVEIYDINSKITWQGKYDSETNIDVSNYLSGIYIVKFYYNKNVVSVKKMVKR